MEKKDKYIFIARLIGWFIFAFCVPLAYLFYRFDMFKTRSSLALSGWGIIAAIFVGAFIIASLKYVCELFPKTYGTICLKQFCKVVLPLLILTIIVYSIKVNADAFYYVLAITTLSETIAILLNPLPKLIDDKNKERQEETIDKKVDSFFVKLKSTIKGEQK